MPLKLGRNLNNLYKLGRSKKITISEGLSSIFIISILISGFATVYIFHRFTTEKRLRDTFGLVHLEMEQKVQKLVVFLNQITSTTNEIPTPVWLEQKLDKSSQNESDLNLDLKLKLFKKNSQYFLVHRTNILENKVFPVNELDSWLQKNIFKECQCFIYFTEMTGELLAANSLKINPLSVSDRPLVRQFIDQTLNQLQSRFFDKNGVQWLGYYHQIPGSNIVFFHEIKESKLFGDIIYSLWGAVFFCATFSFRNSLGGSISYSKNCTAIKNNYRSS